MFSSRLCGFPIASPLFILPDELKSDTRAIRISKELLLFKPL